MVLAVAKNTTRFARRVARVVARGVLGGCKGVARRLLGCSGWLLGGC